MLDQLKELVWWPEMIRNDHIFVKTCNLECPAAISRNETPPIDERKTIKRPTEHCLVDYKGL